MESGYESVIIFGIMNTLATCANVKAAPTQNHYKLPSQKWFGFSAGSRDTNEEPNA